MRFKVLVALHAFAQLGTSRIVASAFSFNAYDLGLQGLYPTQRYHSTDLIGPAPRVTRWDSRCDVGKLLVTPNGGALSPQAKGPVILNSNGEMVWMGNKQFPKALNLMVQKYKGKDYLTFWTRTEKGAKKSKKRGSQKQKKKQKHNRRRKSYVMLDSSYNVNYTVYPHGKKLKGDSHEFRITAQNTALITIYHKRQVDCTDLNLGKSCWIKDGVFQEIDIETGNLLFEWRSTDHVGMKEVFSAPCIKDGHGKNKKDAFDYFHINSVDKMESGDYLISARYLHGVLCIDGVTGKIKWQLGGKNNNFKDINGAITFSWQHHATWHGNNTLTLFDNHANSVFHSPYIHSRGMLIQLDLEKMTAMLIQDYAHPDGIVNVSQGSIQLIPESSNVLVGFGNSPTYVEFDRDGSVLCSAHFGPHLVFELIDFGFVKSYRTFKSPWVGRPNTVPDMKVKGGKVYVSWNGATEVAAWRLEQSHGKESASNDKDFVTVQELSAAGFETRFELERKSGKVRMAALDKAGNVMAYSASKVASSPRSALLWVTLAFAFVVVNLLVLYSYYPKLRKLRVPRFTLRSRRQCTLLRRRKYERQTQGDGTIELISETDPLLGV